MFYPDLLYTNGKFRFQVSPLNEMIVEDIRRKVGIYAMPKGENSQEPVRQDCGKRHSGDICCTAEAEGASAKSVNLSGKRTEDIEELFPFRFRNGKDGYYGSPACACNAGFSVLMGCVPRDVTLLRQKASCGA